jgi:hypothetical protein
MKAWIEQKMRRLLVAGAVAFTVGAPTIACMGGEVSDGAGPSDDGPAGDDDGDDDDAQGAKAKLQGTWRYFPVEEELRTLKIINAALSGRKKAIEKLKPLNAEEQATYDEFKGLSKDDPMAQAMSEIIKVMKGATIEFDGDSFKLSNPDGTTTTTFEVKSESGDKATIVIAEGPTGEEETHELEFVSNSKVEDHVTTTSGAQFFFELKKK